MMRKFRRFASVAVWAASPIVLFLFVEALLRAVHFGYSPSFFCTVKAGDRRLVRDNPWFFHRFFPPPLARSTGRFVFEEKKPDDLFRIFVFGSSAAMGDPDFSYSFSRMLEKMLAAAHPERRFEVINTAATAINSHVVLPIVRECGRRQPDLYIVLMGNNEVIGPYGPGTVLTSWRKNVRLIRLSIALRATRWGQIADRLRSRMRKTPPELKEWGGLELFIKHRFRADDPALDFVYQAFGENLDRICRAAQKSRTPLLLCTVPSNVVDQPPFMPVPASLEPAKAESCRALRQQAAEAEKSGDLLAARRFYAAAADLSPDDAELWYRLGRCSAALGDTAARGFFLHARDLDGLRFRADSRLNDLIRRSAAAAGAAFVDLEKLLLEKTLAADRPSELFFDHVHFTPAGNYAVARSLFPLVEESLSLPPAEPPSFEDVLRSLAYTGWDALRQQDEMVQRFSRPPFTAMVDHERLLQKAQARLHNLQALKSPQALAAADAMYAAAVARSPEDWVLQENYAKFLLTALNDAASALERFEKVVERLPNDALALNNLGVARGRLGLWGEAEEAFRAALRQNPFLRDAAANLVQALIEQEKLAEAEAELRDDLPAKRAAELYNSLGIRWARSGSTDRALARFRAAQRCDPNFAEAYYNSGMTLKRIGRAEDALGDLSRAVQLMPENLQARLELADALRVAGRLEDAVAQYKIALRQQPDRVEARNDLGILYAQLGLFSEALSEFNAALAVDPKNLPALSNQATALRLIGRSDEAVAVLKKAARLSNRPEFPYKIGLEFLKQNRPDSARFYFQRAFELQADFMPAVEKLDSLNRLGAVR